MFVEHIVRELKEKKPFLHPHLEIGFIQCRIELKKIFRAKAKVTVNIFKSPCHLRRLFLLPPKKNFFLAFFLIFSEKKSKLFSMLKTVDLTFFV